jgi:S-DNA-T family DNA segregation ATPase FtsK/SpoIIIE
MPTKGNQFKTNTLRDDTKPDRSSPKSEKEKASRKKQEKMPSFNLHDGRAAKIAGLFFLVMSVFFLIAFTCLPGRKIRAMYHAPMAAGTTSLKPSRN